MIFITRHQTEEVEKPGEEPFDLNSAVLYTLLGSCRRHGINPFDYLRDLIARLPAAKITEIAQFTPRAWAKANPVRLASVA